MKLHHVAVVCHSQENADRFYGEILGLKQIKSFTLNRELVDQIFDVNCECQMILYGNENFAVEVFVTSVHPEKVNPFVHLCIEVENKEKLAENCQAKGLETKRISRGDGSLIFVKDYDGNLFEIK